MPQQNDDLALGTGLIRKGEARGLSPALAAPPTKDEPQAPPPAMNDSPIATSPAVEHEPSATTEEPEPPLRAAPPDDVAKRFTSFRLPVTLDEDLRAMIFETRRSKQDLLIEFVTAGVQAWRRDRLKRK